MTKLDRKFFERSSVDVAPDLLGKVVVFGKHEGIITETEAYRGDGDPACHAAKGLTPRTEVLFGPPGHCYVYFIYGMYFCMNFVTETDGVAGGVLIRGLQIKNGPNLDGPGKLCRFLGVTKDKHNKADIVASSDFYVKDEGHKPKFIITPRIGISQGKELPWRFLVEK